MNKVEKLKEIILEYKKQREEESNMIRSGQWNDKKRSFYGRKINELNDKLMKLGLEFQCTDYGEEYCLDLRGLEVVLKAIEE